jgi:hypothetical protein
MEAAFGLCGHDLVFLLNGAAQPVAVDRDGARRTGNWLSRCAHHTLHG